MGRMISFIGGSRSGKSAFAEKCAGNFSSVIYYAATSEKKSDGEMKDRIREHKLRRPENWITLSVDDTDIKDLKNICVEKSSNALVFDCATLWLTYELLKLDEGLSYREKEESLRKKIDDFLDTLSGVDCQLFIVSNEVGSGIVPEHAMGRVFRDLQGYLNKALTDKSSLGFFMVAGRALLIKDEINDNEDFAPAYMVTDSWVKRRLIQDL